MTAAGVRGQGIPPGGRRLYCREARIGGVFQPDFFHEAL